MIVLEQPIIEVIKYVLLFFSTYYFMMLITVNDKKIAKVGTIIVCLSSYLFFWGVPNAIICGQAIVLAIYHILTSEKKTTKALLTVAIGVLAGAYLGFNDGYYTGFERLLFFVYVAVTIWVILDNKTRIKFKKEELKYFIPCIVLAVLLCIGTIWIYNANVQFSPFLNVDENGHKVIELEETKGNGLQYLLSYGYAPFLIFTELSENLEYMSFLSIFPLSLILAMLYLYKKEKHIEFLMPMIIVITLECIFCMTKLPIFKFIGFTESLRLEVCANAVSLACIYLYIYMIANVKESVFSLTKSAKVILGFLVFYFLIPRPEAFASRGYMYSIVCIITLLYFIFINYTDSRYKRVLSVILVMWAVASFFPVIKVLIMYFINSSCG